MSESGSIEPGAAAPSLADKLNRLFEAAHGSGERPPTNRAVAEGVTEGGTPISESFLHYLRNGARDNPTMKHLEGIARYFGVPAAYFFEDGEDSRRLYDELELITAMRDEDVRAIATRSSRMTPRMRRWLIETLKTFDPDEPESPPADPTPPDRPAGDSGP